MILTFTNSIGLTAFLKLAFVIYSVRGENEQSIKDSISEFDLLSVALSDMENSNSGGVAYVEGADGFPAFSIASSANLRSPYRLVVPEKLEEFTIMATMRANKLPDGYLFAIVNSLDTVIQLGVKVSASPNHNNLNISLVYNDAYVKTPSESLASFQLPYEPKVWINFAIQVMNDRISLYHNCIKIQELNVSKEPKELVFESSSTFYLAQAGNSGSSREKFEDSAPRMLCADFRQNLQQHIKWHLLRGIEVSLRPSRGYILASFSSDFTANIKAVRQTT